MRRYTIYNRLTAVAAGLCLCWLFMAFGGDRGGGGSGRTGPVRA